MPRRKCWEQCKVDKLLDLIGEKPCLWDAENTSYNDSKARSIAFDIIAQEMHLPRSEVRIKYTKLRWEYRKHRRTQNTKWRFFKAMEFLMSKSSLEDEIETKPKIGIKTENDDDNHTDTISVGSNSNNGVTTQTAPTLQIHNNVMPESQIEETPLLEENILINATKESQQSPDEHTLFGQYIANEVRILENQKKLQKTLKCAILEAVLNINKIQ